MAMWVPSTMITVDQEVELPATWSESEPCACSEKLANQPSHFWSNFCFIISPPARMNEPTLHPLIPWSKQSWRCKPHLVERTPSLTSSKPVCVWMFSVMYVNMRTRTRLWDAYIGRNETPYHIWRLQRTLHTNGSQRPVVLTILTSQLYVYLLFNAT